MFNKCFVFLLISLSSFVHAADVEWKVRDLGTLSTFNDAAIHEFNENGQALISGHIQGETYNNKPRGKINPRHKKCSWGFWDSQKGLMLLEDSWSRTLLQEDPWTKTMTYNWHRVNGQGMVIGLAKGHANDNVEHFRYLLTWYQDNYHLHLIPPVNQADHSTTGAFIARCRNSDSVVVTCYDKRKGELYDSKIFSLLNDQMQDLTPLLSESATLLGYDAQNWLAITVNSQDVILGRFNYYEKNPYKDKKSIVGRKYFLWNGNDLTIIDGAEKLFDWYVNDSFSDVNDIFLDAKGRVLFYTFIMERHAQESWLWSKEIGLKYIAAGHIRAIGLLDDGTVFWSITGSQKSDGFLFQKEDQIFDGLIFPKEKTLLSLNLDRNRRPYPEHLGEFEDIKILTAGSFGSSYYGLWHSPKGEFVLNANSQRQLFFTGKVYGEQHPFVIEPVAK